MMCETGLSLLAVASNVACWFTRYEERGKFSCYSSEHTMNAMALLLSEFSIPTDRIVLLAENLNTLNLRGRLRELSNNM